jgi:hypothetical protein
MKMHIIDKLLYYQYNYLLGLAPEADTNARFHSFFTGPTKTLRTLLVCPRRCKRGLNLGAVCIDVD